MPLSSEIYIQVGEKLRTKLYLGEAPEEMDFYLFLGISEKEQNTSIIEEAAFQRIRELQAWIYSPLFVAEAGQLLQKVEWIRTTLTDPARRSLYDQKLQETRGMGRDKAKKDLERLVENALSKSPPDDQTYAFLVQETSRRGLQESDLEDLMKKYPGKYGVFIPLKEPAPVQAPPPLSPPPQLQTPEPIRKIGKKDKLLFITFSIIGVFIIASIALFLIMKKYSQPPLEDKTIPGNLPDSRSSTPMPSPTPTLTPIPRATTTPTQTPTPTPTPTPIPRIEGFTYIPPQPGKRGGFYIADHQVTVEEYYQFMKEEWWRKPITWEKDTPPLGSAKRPVNGVSFSDGEGYCKWRAKAYNKPQGYFDIPAIEEWKQALASGWNPYSGKDASSSVGDWCRNVSDREKGLVILPGQEPENARPLPLYSRDDATGFRLVIKSLN